MQATCVAMRYSCCSGVTRLQYMLCVCGSRSVLNTRNSICVALSFGIVSWKVCVVQA
jgi:hypothetical protein